MTQERSDNKLGKEVAARFSSGSQQCKITDGLTVLMQTFDNCMWKHNQVNMDDLYHEQYWSCFLRVRLFSDAVLHVAKFFPSGLVFEICHPPTEH